MPFLAPVAAIAGTALSAAGSIEGGEAAKQQADYRSAIAQRNAIVAGMEQATAIQAGEQKTAEVSLAGAQKLGAVKTGLAAGNVDINTGSAVGVRASERMANALNAQTTMWNAQRAGWGYAQQAAGQMAQSQLDKLAGKQAETAGYFGAAGDIFKGLGNVVSPTSLGALGFGGSASPVASNNLGPGGDVSDPFDILSSGGYASVFS